MSRCGLEHCGVLSALSSGIAVRLIVSMLCLEQYGVLPAPLSGIAVV